LGGLVVDLGGYSGFTTVEQFYVTGNVYTFMFGPQASWRLGKFTPFANALFAAGIPVQRTGFSDSDISLPTVFRWRGWIKDRQRAAWRGQLDFSRLDSTVQTQIT